MAEVQDTPNTPPRSALTKQIRVDRSCVLCHQRKIRCDKKLPCRNCSRVDVLCCYPEPEQTVRRPQKPTIADVSARLTRLERTISALSNGSSFKQDVTPPGQLAIEDFNSMDPVGSLVEGASSQEKLVQGDSSSRYFNEALLSRVLEEEQEIKSLIEKQHDGSHSQDSAFLDIDPLFSAYQKPSQEIVSNYPSRQCAVQLWQAFVNNVDPLFKIFHIPSIQGTIYGAINNPINVNAEINTLLFAVYFAGVASLSSEQVMNLLGLTKNASLNTFKQGFEQSLAAASFLENPKLITLQSITLYLFCYRASKGGRAIWTLNGLVTRSAQSIGLHRDGTNFKLSPFECEMRRRLWWAIIANDSRVIEDHGLKIYTSDSAIDVALPLNVNDSELYPGMKNPPIAKPKWSDMSFTLMAIESHKVLRNLSLSTPPDTSPTSEVAQQQAFQTLKDRFETEYLKHCDQNIPIQRMTYLIGKLLPSKLDFVNHQQWLRHHSQIPSNYPLLSSTSETYQGTEEDLLHACEILEISDHFRTDDMLQGYQWNIRAYPQYHVLIFVYRYLCVAPECPSTDRAWILANTCFESEAPYDASLNWTVLSKLREKAMRARNFVSAGGKGGVFNEKDTNGSEIEQSFGMETAITDGVGGSGAQEADLFSNMNWSPNAFDGPFWGSMMGSGDVENFESEASVMPWANVP